MPQKPSKLMPALYGGIIMGVISGIPFLSFVNCFCCAGILFGGFMSVFFYKKDLTPDMPTLTSADGLQLGALAGVFGAVVSNILSGLLLFTVGNIAGGVIYDLIIKTYDSLGILNQLPPEALEQLEEGTRERMMSPLTVFASFIIDPLFGLLGGLLGYAVFKPKQGLSVPPQAPPAQV